MQAGTYPSTQVDGGAAVRSFSVQRVPGSDEVADVSDVDPNLQQHTVRHTASEHRNARGRRAPPGFRSQALCSAGRRRCLCIQEGPRCTPSAASGPPAWPRP